MDNRVRRHDSQHNRGRAALQRRVSPPTHITDVIPNRAEGPLRNLLLIFLFTITLGVPHVAPLLRDVGIVLHRLGTASVTLAFTS
jgi:hypothetical protein